MYEVKDANSTKTVTKYCQYFTVHPDTDIEYNEIIKVMLFIVCTCHMEHLKLLWKRKFCFSFQTHFMPEKKFCEIQGEFES